MIAQTFWSRFEPHRIIALFRLVVAGLLFWAGDELGLGAESRQAYLVMTSAYAASSLLIGSTNLIARLGSARVSLAQFILDIVLLTFIMAISGGFRSGMPVLMMMYLAAAGVVSKGRIGLFLASLAALAVLSENLFRHFTERGAIEFFQVGLTCSGFFAIAYTSHLLANRARRSEALAVERGKALGQQRAINELIIEDMSDGVVVVNNDGLIRQANPRAALLLGTSLEPGVKLESVDSQFAALHQWCQDAASVVIQINRTGREVGCRCVLTGDPTSSPPDGQRDAIVYLTDQEEIRRQAQQLKLAALGRLATSLAHEIRNPLSAIQQAADLLVSERSPAQRDRLTDMIGRNGKRIERLVRDVLAAGRMSAYPETLGLREFVVDIIEELCLASPQAKQRFALAVDHHHTLSFDRAHLHQVLGNLICNALRHSSDKPGSIRIHSTQDSDCIVSLHIIDDGSGINMNQQTHLFEPFLSNHPQGIGLGLYIGRELAEINGAQLIFAGNEPGAHFVITGHKQT